MAHEPTAAFSAPRLDHLSIPNNPSSHPTISAPSASEVVASNAAEEWRFTGERNTEQKNVP
jgi:hypothetical protein